MNGIWMGTMFPVAADPDTVYRGRLAVAVRDLKARLQARYEGRFPGEGKRIRAVIAEAETAAWYTEFPHLFLPDLADEAIARLPASSNSEQRDGSSSLTNMA